MVKKTGTEIPLMAVFTAKPGKEDELVETIYGLMEPTLAEEGCMRFIVYQDKENPAVVTAIEKFASQEAFDKHVEMPYIKDFLGNKVPELTATDPVITFHQELLV